MKTVWLRWSVSLLALALFVGNETNPVSASDLSKETSIPLVPQDADFYTATFRMEEQFRQFLQCKSMVELQKVGVVKQVIQQLSQEWQEGTGQMAQARAAFNTPLAQDILKTIIEMASEEAFVFGDSKTSDFLIGFAQLQKEMAVAVNGGQDGLLDWVDSLTKEDIKLIPVPTIVAGFKFKDEDRALTILDQIQALASLGLNAVPQTAIIAEKIERVEDARGTRLVFNFSSDMIPWDTLAEAGPEAVDVVNQLEEILEGRKFALTIGTLDKYIVFALSEEGKQIARLGKANNSKSLWDNADLKPLVEAGNKEFTGIAYISDKFSDAQFESQWRGYFSNLYAQFEPLLELSFAGNADPDRDTPSFIDSLESDLEWLDDEMEQLVPEFKGSLAYTFTTSKGVEGYLHNRTESVYLDGSKKLEVLQHVGEAPLAMAAYRHGYNPKWLTLSRKVVRKIRTYLDGFVASSLLDSNDMAEWEIILKKGWPLLKRSADIFEQKLQPSTKDGQSAWTISIGSLQSKQWAKEMPPSSQPLPLPELAIVTGLSDKGAFIEGCSDMFGVLDSLLEVVRELNPSIAPAGYSIPRPEKSVEAGTELYRYLIPDDCPVPKEMAPQIAVDDHWAIASYSSNQSKSLIRRSTLGVGRNVIQSDKELAAASYCDLGGLMKAMSPWVRYGLEMNEGLDEFVVPPKESMPGLKGTDILEIWQAMTQAGRVISSTEIPKGGPTITHWVYEE